ncbi:TPA: accessory Sec system protein Asp1 [Streptococcus suis]
MYYFVPSWYGESKKWVGETPYWFRVIEQLSFDDSIHQIKMFENSDEEARMLILGYQPHFRYFLHKLDIHSTSYWSFFDDIQGIQSNSVKIVDFKELSWPEGTYFIYSPFAALARVGDQLLAEIHFSENGTLLAIQFFKDHQMDKRYLFDDRGFLSSIQFFENGQLLHHDFLNQNGVWQVREWHQQDQCWLEVNPQSDRAFMRSSYESWDQLIEERLEVVKFKMIRADDVVVIAADQQHTEMLLEVFIDHTKMVSFFSRRLDVNNRDLVMTILSQSTGVLVDSETTHDVLNQLSEEEGLPTDSIYRMTPFDTRLRLGQSHNMKEMILYCLVDGISDVHLDRALKGLLGLVEENPLLSLHFVTYKRQYPLTALEQKVKDIIYSTYDPSKFFSPKSDSGENQIDTQEEVETNRVTFSLFSTEEQIIQALDTARLYIDLSETPDLYSQIASLSAGIPQILLVQSDFVKNHVNGWILTDVEEINKAVHYFCDGLANWNQSLVGAVERMSDYTSGRLIEQWKEFVKK